MYVQICVAAKSLYNAIMGQTVFTHPHYVIPHLLRQKKKYFKGPYQSLLGLAAVISGAEGIGHRSGIV